MVKNDLAIAADAMTQADRSELFGRLVDAVEDWLEAKGFKPGDFPNGERDEGDEAIICGCDYDDLADRFSEAIGISRYCDELEANPR